MCLNVSPVFERVVSDINLLSGCCGVVCLWTAQALTRHSKSILYWTAVCPDRHTHEIFRFSRKYEIYHSSFSSMKTFLRIGCFVRFFSPPPDVFSIHLYSIFDIKELISFSIHMNEYIIQIGKSQGNE